MTASVLQEAFADDAFGSGTTLTTPALGSNAAVGSTIEVWFTVSNTATLPTVTDSASQTYTSKGTVFDATHGSQQLSLFVCQNNASATKLTVTATFTGAQTGKALWVKEIGGVSATSYDNSNLLIKSAPGTGANAVTNTAVTPSSSPVLCSGIAMECFVGNGSDLAAGTGYTLGTSGWAYGSGTVLAKSESKRLATSVSTAGTFTAATNGASGIYLVGLSMYDESSGAVNTTITPTVGSETAAGVAPVLKTAFTIAPTAGTATLAGVAPAPVQGAVITTSVGSVALSNAAPVIVRGTVLSVSTGALTLTGLTTGISRSAVIPVGAITLNGLSPALLSAVTITPAVGSIALSGIVPTEIVGTIIATAAGALTLAGTSSTLRLNVTPIIGVTTIVGALPVLSVSSGVTVTPTVGALTLSGIAPSVSATAKVTIIPALGTTTLSGSTPTLILSAGSFITPSSGAVSLASAAAALSFSITPQIGALALTGIVPAAIVNAVRATSAGAVALSGVASALGLSIAPPAASSNLTGSVSTLTTGRTITAQSGLATLTGVGSALGINASVPSAALIVVGAAPTNGGVSIAPLSAVLSVQGQAASTGNVCVPLSGQVLMRGQAPYVNSTYTVLPRYLQPQNVSPLPSPNPYYLLPEPETA